MSAKPRPRADSPNPKDSLGALKVPLEETCGIAEIWWAFAQYDGKQKYGRKNWRNKAVSITVYMTAARRHIMAMVAGEDIDEKSGLPHAGHVMACMAIIEDARAAGCLIDDRSEKDMAAMVLNALTSDNYNAATLALTRTPARTLDEVRGGRADFGAFLAQIASHQKGKREAAAYVDAQVAKAAKKRRK